VYFLSLRRGGLARGIKISLTSLEVFKEEFRKKVICAKLRHLRMYTSSSLRALRGEIFLRSIYPINRIDLKEHKKSAGGSLIFLFAVDCFSIPIPIPIPTPMKMAGSAKFEKRFFSASPRLDRNY